MISLAIKQINLQDSFLNQVRKENVGVTIHLVNGFQIKGNVKGFDNFTVILDVMGKQQMVYKLKKLKRPTRKHMVTKGR